jgi:hypothetical protein
MTRAQFPIFAALLSIVATTAAFAEDGQPAPAAAPQTAAPQSPATAGAKPTPPNPDDQVICKREPEPGSRLGGQRVCLTRRDWRQQSDDARDSMSRLPSPH